MPTSQPTIQSRYLAAYNEFSAVLDYAMALSDKQRGHTPENNQQNYGEKIFLKLLCHAITLRNLSPHPGGNVQNELWDIASQYAVARTLIETYEALAYVALEPVCESEREFRMLLWRLNSAERRSGMLELIGSKDPEFQSVLATYHSVKEQTLAHPFVAKTGNALKKKIQQKETPPFHLSRRERDIRCGINADYHTVVIMHLSQYVHTLPFSIDQLSSFQAGDPECLRLMSIAVEYSIGFLAKSIVGVIELFSPRVPPVTPELANALAVWENLLARGVKNIDTAA